MPPALAQSLAETLARWQALPGRIRALLLVGVAAGGVVALTTWAITTMFVDYQVLFSNLSAEDASTVVEALRAARVPHRVADGGQVLGVDGVALGG